ncbi:MAG: hypothetical protein N2C12_07875 [Planctomycetales bacterium]
MTATRQDFTIGSLLLFSGQHIDIDVKGVKFESIFSGKCPVGWADEGGSLAKSTLPVQAN